MTAKPVRDLLYSKSRNQPKSSRIDSIRQIEIEQVSRPNDFETEAEKSRTSIDMKELTILNERSMPRSDVKTETETETETEIETKSDRFAVDDNESLAITTWHPTDEKITNFFITNTTG
jgi:hypothetical protein